MFFDGIIVSNLRTPCAVVVRETPEGGLYGEKGIFGNGMETKDGWFCLSGSKDLGTQVTARPTSVSCPMLRSRFTVPQGGKSELCQAVLHGERYL